MQYLIVPSIALKNNKLTSTDKLLMGMIYSLSKNSEYCYASNNYLANMLNVSKRTITSSLSKLKKEDLINIKYQNSQRQIYLKVWNSTSRGMEIDCYTPLETNFYHKRNNKNKNKNIKIPEWLNNYDELEEEQASAEEIKELDKLLSKYN